MGMSHMCSSYADGMSPQLCALQIQEMVAAQRWAVQAFCHTEMSKLMSIARDLHRERQAHVSPPSPIEARCLLVCLGPPPLLCDCLCKMTLPELSVPHAPTAQSTPFTIG